MPKTSLVKLFHGISRKPAVQDEPLEAAHWRSLGAKLTIVTDLFVVRTQSDSGKRFLKSASQLRAQFENEVCTASEFETTSNRFEVLSAEFAIDQREEIETLINDLGAAVTDTLQKFEGSIDAAGKPIGALEEIRRDLSQAQTVPNIEDVRRLLAQSVTGLQKVVQDQSERERVLRAQFQEHSRRLSQHLAQAHEDGRTDALTALSNRRGFQEHMESSIAKARLEEGKRCLALLDLDGFKTINDTFGHAAGDAALVTFATRLRKAVGEKAFIARFGGDEFAVEAEMTPSMLEGMFIKLANICGEHPCFHEDRRMTIRFSYGIALYGGDEEEADIRKKADAALYEFKQNRQVRRSA